MSAYRVPVEPPPRVPAIVVFVAGVFVTWAWALILSQIIPS